MEQLLSSFLGLPLVLLILGVIILKSSVKFVPQNREWLVERFGKFHSTKSAGINFVVPFVDRVAADRSLKEQTYDVPEQSAITKDNISLSIDGVLYLKVLDSYKATYGIEDYVFAVTKLAQTTMRSELGKMELDKTFEDREILNTNIVQAINEAAQPWGIQVLRYEIMDITPPQSVMTAMESQMKAEREKRAVILESEGQKSSAINVADGDKQARVLAAEADKQEQILRAEGEARAIVAVAVAQAGALTKVGEVAATDAGQKAVQFDLAGRAIDAKQAIAKESSVVLLPDSATDTASLVAQGMSVLKQLQGEKS